MTLSTQDRALHRAYDAAREGKLGARMHIATQIADAAFGGMHRQVGLVNRGQRGLRAVLPNDDRAETLTMAAFRLALEAVGENPAAWQENARMF